MSRNMIRNFKAWFTAIGVAVLAVGFIGTSLASIGQSAPKARPPVVEATDASSLQLYLPSLSRLAAGTSRHVE